jgi:uncharacterized phiE125 gp8 family phage protein
MLNITTDYITEIGSPAIEPVSVAEARDHLRVDIDTDDLLIYNMIAAAREYVEIYCNRSFAKHAYRADIAGFENQMRLPGKPIQSVTHIKYYSSASPSVLTTLATSNYQLHRDVVSLSYGGTWPAVYPRPDGVQITYQCGYSDLASPSEDTVANTPKSVRQAILLTVGDLYENREGQIIYPGQVQENKTVKMLLAAYRVYA